MSKILLICNESKTVINFRKELILYLHRNGHEVEVIVGDDLYLNDIVKLPVVAYLVPFKNRSINPFASLNLKCRFKNVIKESKPDIVFTFQLKPNIFGGLAASKIKNIKLYSMVEGLGDPFQPHNLKGIVIREIVSWLYKKAFRFSKRVFFLNNSDMKEMVTRRILIPSKCKVIPSIGIDTSTFQPIFVLPDDVHVSYFARLLKNKGIFDFCEIARATRKLRKDIQFDLYGSESEIKVAEIKQYIDDESIVYHGYVTDVADAISRSHLILSTSFREGFPRIILEAMALGRPVVATNVIGNKDAVVDGITGYLLEKGDIFAFRDTIIKLIDDKNLIIRMGQEARTLCVNHYDSEIINECILKEIL